MSDSTLPPSPDYFGEPKKHPKMRRLNGWPMRIICALVAIIVIAIGYSFYDKQNAAAAFNQAQAAAAPHVNETAKPPVGPPKDSGNEAPPPPPPTTTAGNDKPPASNTTNTTALQRRQRQIEQLEDKRLARLEEALDADTSVPSNPTITNVAKPSLTANTQGQIARPNPEEMMNRLMAASRGSAGGMGGAEMAMGAGMSAANAMAAENAQDQKRAFLAGTVEANVYLEHQRQAAVVMSQELKAGSVIPGVMISGINSDLPGQIIGQVREDVYDSPTGLHLLIPAGARLIGTYDSNVTLGQQRALVAWKRIIYPDGSSLSLDKMPGADQSGYAGFNDQVNNHYGRIFGSGLLLSVFAAGLQLSQPQASNGQNLNSQQIIAGSIGQQMGQLGMQMAQRNMNIQPTLEIRPGYEFNVMVTKDIILPTWQGHPLAKVEE